MIDIVSLHILKTGGMSFLDILKNQYGEQAVYRYIENDTRLKKIRRKIILNTFSSKTKVIHGHFIFQDVEHIVKRNKSKVVVWFREPVERIISRYYFLMKRIENNPKHPKISFKNDSLLDFANRPSQKNMMSRFVEGIALEDLFFFGFLESFESDLKILTQKLNWKSFKTFHKNSNREYKNKYINQISEEVKKEIKIINQKDYELYNRALDLKNINISK